jgi:ADP-heptose:LPS heptosyltransferase
MNSCENDAVLVHLASGVGNIVLATPLLRVLDRAGFVVDVLLDADYAGVTELLKGWSAIRCVYDGRYKRPSRTAYAQSLVAVPPFYWRRYALAYAREGSNPYRPPDDLFFRDEQAYYLDFARMLGCDISDPPRYFLPVAPTASGIAGPTTIAIAPGCKTGVMTAKRWPFFPQLAAMFDDIVLVGTDDDLTRFDGTVMHFPNHVRSMVGMLSLRETAGVLAGAGAVVANDCGLGHVAGALGVPTVLLFGPTPHAPLGNLPANVTILRTGLECEPCWHAARYRACERRIDCLRQLSVTTVATTLREIMSTAAPGLTHG